MMDVVVYGLAVVGALFIVSLLAGALWVAVVTVARRRRPVQSTFHRPPTAGDAHAYIRDAGGGTVWVDGMDTPRKFSDLDELDALLDPYRKRRR